MDGRSPPLGVFAGPAAGRDRGRTLPPGSRLVLYTDGLIERRGESWTRASNGSWPRSRRLPGAPRRRSHARCRRRSWTRMRTATTSACSPSAGGPRAARQPAGARPSTAPRRRRARAGASAATRRCPSGRSRTAPVASNASPIALEVVLVGQHVLPRRPTRARTPSPPPPRSARAAGARPGTRRGASTCCCRARRRAGGTSPSRSWTRASGERSPSPLLSSWPSVTSAAAGPSAANE